MWGRILEGYDPRGKDVLFKSVSTLYTLEQVADETICAYMSCARRRISGLRGVTFNTMTNLFIIVNSYRSRFGALADRFRAGNPEVVNADVDRLKTFLEAIESRSCVLDGQPLPRTCALRGH